MKGVIGTAGHIDHGKTALVASLTGVDTDRLPEEQRRGISIDLGFTHLDTDAGPMGIIDVPGHEDFIRNMLAGATGIDLLLLVVAADEGVMPQTREHVAIAELLGVRQAVVALTKTDLVDEAWLDLAREDVTEFLAGTAFADATILPTSASTGDGVPELRDAIVQAFGGSPRRGDDLFRLPVDRAFTIRGTGTVVTGTVWSGRLRRDEEVRLLPGGPGARVRGLQVHGREVDEVEAGERAAVALAGLDRGAADRGLSVVTDRGWRETLMLTVSGRVLAGSDWSIETRQRVRVHLGTAEVMARAVPLGGERLAPGEEGWLQLRLERPLLARTGDRLVIRSYSPVTTIGGGRVVEPLPPRRTRLRAADRRRLQRLAGGSPLDAVDAALEQAAGQGVAAAEIPVRTGASPDAVRRALRELGATEAGERWFHPDAVARIRGRLEEAVDAHHAERPLQPGADPERLRRSVPRATDAELVDRVLTTLVEEGTLAMRDGRVARAGFVPTLTADQEQARNRLLAALVDAGTSPPKVEELARTLGHPPGLDDLLGLLQREGRVVRLEHDLYIHADTMARAVEGVQKTLGGRDGLSPADFREVIRVSRRYLIPILEYLDREGVTVRDADGRTVAAPG